MTSLARVRAAINREEHDLVPVFPMHHYASTRAVGMKISQYATSGESMARALLAAYRKYGYDGICPGVDVTIEAEALGSVTVQPDDASAFVVKPVVQAYSDLDRLEVPNPREAGRMPVLISATEICAREVGDEAYISSWIHGPLVCASQVRGVERLMFDFMDAPAFVERLLDFCAEVVLAYGKAQIEAGSRMVSIGEALCSPAFISPRLYREYVAPRQKTLIQGLLAYGAEATLLHICGNTMPILDDMVGTGASVLDIDWPVDMAAVTKRVTARGNLDPSSVLLFGTREDVVAKAKEIIVTAGPDLGLILGSGCDVSPDTPAENIAAMVWAAREFGTYPIQRLRTRTNSA